jgi:hypothetical protein
MKVKIIGLCKTLNKRPVSGRDCFYLVKVGGLFTKRESNEYN